ncbi:transcriptional regulator [Ancylobacter sp. Lp-2]|uniref:BTAD domain-containing putative transcriptional regulator n=1 Tax=Ancylobacter sp. Lp-2 TaxID=2881339 RepID=UPI001E39B8B1|nr:BTAD domain-containing putative transcriptional regulator [Ancylobacter sp. Lp-2]MCB4771302.1 transcriptional regulator [Ancylobacter sp. Lp-2]
MTVETREESDLSPADAAASGLRLRLLGALKVERDGRPVELPASRKVRALLAFLALSPRPVARSRLCDMLWDVPDDPRSELRWCLSRMRAALDTPGRPRVVASGDMVALDLEDCDIDIADIEAAMSSGIDGLGVEQLTRLAGRFVGNVLEGLALERCPTFDTWLAAQRRRLHACHVAILEQLATRLAGDEASMPHLERWIELSPFDPRAHTALLGALACQGRHSDAEEHLAAVAKLFTAEALDVAPVRRAWRSLRMRGPTMQPVSLPAAVAALLPPEPEADLAASRRASLAVMPFAGQHVSGGVADGLTHDIITRLAKLRSLFIIARGSVYALAERGLSPEAAARRLNVDYVASGTVRRLGSQTAIDVELVEARTARIVWAEAYDYRPDDAFACLEEIGDRIVAAIAGGIEKVERDRAILKPPNSLNAWEAYHRGLWHMYRFTRDENAMARHFFERAIALDPTYSRAYSGLSFTHWQSAFQEWGHRNQDAELAFKAAGQSLIVDEYDPSAHWAMGRALWLRDRSDEAVLSLERAVDLSPNFALGHYALAFVHSQSGDASTAIDAADHSRHLSPFDPLLFGMLGARAMAHVRLGQFEEAAEWALKAAARPNAHVIILAIAAHCLALAGRIEEARDYMHAVRALRPDYRVEDFLGTFRFSPDARALFQAGARRLVAG